MSSTNANPSIPSDAQLAQTVADAHLIDAFAKIETAESLRSTALVGGFIATAVNGPCKPFHVVKGFPSCENPGVYASMFNRGAKAAKAIGTEATLDLIARVESLPGGRIFDRVKEALGNVATIHANAGGKMTKAAIGKAVTATLQADAAKVKAAKAEADKAKAERAKAKEERKAKGPAKRGAKDRKAANVKLAVKIAEAGKGAKETHAALASLVQAARAMPEVEGREAATKVARAKLEAACEAWAALAK